MLLSLSLVPFQIIVQLGFVDTVQLVKPSPNAGRCVIMLRHTARRELEAVRKPYCAFSFFRIIPPRIPICYCRNELFKLY